MERLLGKFKKALSSTNGESVVVELGINELRLTVYALAAMQDMSDHLERFEKKRSALCDEQPPEN